MAYPARIDPQLLIDESEKMIEASGLGAFSLGKLAAKMGVKTPSLYRHIGNKDKLLADVSMQTARKMFAAMEAAQEATAKPEEQLLQLAVAQWHFAHDFPHTYALLFAAKPDSQRPDPKELERMVLPIQALVVELSGEEHALSELRGLVALIHGFIMLDLNGSLRRGGDLFEAFRHSIGKYVQGCQKS